MDEAVRKKRLWRRVLWCALGLMVFVLLVVAGVFLFGQTGAGRAQIASILSRVLTERLARDFRIEGVRGFVPFAMRVDRISIGDDEGTWLLAEDINIGLTSSALFRRQVNIHSLGVKRLHVLRRPLTEEKEERAWEVPALPKLPTWLRVSSAKVDALQLDAPVLGQAATFEASGAFLPQKTGGGWEVTLDLSRTDQEGTQAELRIASGSERMEAMIDLQDATLLPALAQVPPPFVLLVEAGGPLDDWRAEVTAAAGGVSLLAGAVRLEGNAPMQVAANGSVDLLHPLLPVALAEALGPKADLEVRGTLTPGGRLDLTLAQLNAPRAGLKSQGVIELEANTLDLSIGAAHEDLRQWLPRKELETPVPADIAAKISGDFRDFTLSLETEAAGAQLLAGQWQIDLNEGTTVDGDYTITPSESLLPEAAHALAGTPLNGSLDVTLAPDRRVEVRRFIAGSGDWLALNAEGTLDQNEETAGLAAMIDLRDAEPLAALLDQPVAGAFTAELRLNGNTEGVGATLTLDAAELSYQDYAVRGAHIEAQTQVPEWPPDFEQDLRVRVTGSGTVLQAARAIERELRVALDAQRQGERILIHELTARDGNLDLNAQGTVEPQAKTGELDAVLTVARLEEYAAIVDQEFSGALSASAQVTTGADRAVNGVVQAAWNQPGGLPEAAAAALGDQLKLDTNFSLRDAVLTLRNTTLSGAAFTARAEGTIHTEAKTADLDIEAQVADLAPLQPGRDNPLGGAMSLTADITTDAERVVRGTVQGAWNDPKGLPEQVRGALGDQLRLNAGFSLADSLLTLESARAEAAGLSADANGTVNLAEKTLDLQAEAQIAELGSLQPGEAKVSGAASASAAVSGAFDNFSATGSATGSNLDLPQLRADRAEFAFDLSGLPRAPVGTLNGHATIAGERLELGTRLESDLPRVRLQAFRLETAGNTLSGALDANVEEKTASGELDAELTDLAKLGRFLNQEMAGAATASAQFSTSGGTMSVSLEAEADRVVTPWVEATRLAATGQVSGLPEDASGTLSIIGGGIRRGAMELGAFEGNWSGDFDSAAISLTANGALRDGLAFAAETAGTASVNAKSATLQTLSGNLEGQAFTLEAPSTVALAEGGVNITPLRLNLSEGRIELAANMSRESVQVTGSWAELPLALVQTFGGPELQGSTEGDLSMSGPAVAPSATLEARVIGLRSAAAPAEVPPGNVTVSAALQGGIVRATAELAVADAGVITGEATIPVRFSTAPFEAVLPEGAGIAGTVRGQADMGAIPALMGIERHLLSGDALLDLQISGPARAPEVQGEVRVAGGRYENTSTGTILDQIEATLNAQRDRLELISLTATDSAKGTLEGTGQLALNQTEDFPFTFDTRLQAARLVRRDDLDGTVTGDLQLEGNIKDMLASGEITVSPIELRLPERLPARKLQVIPVQDVGPRPRDLAQEAEGNLEADFIFPDVATEPADANAPGQNLRFDIRADFPRQVRVTGNGLDSEWRGNLHITGTKADPRLEGTLRVERGVLTFLGRRFDLEESTMIFNANSPPSPFLNIIATAETRDVEARVRLTGNFNALDITMESTPPLPQDEVLSYVLFGKDLSEIGPGQALQLARYASMFSGRQGGMELLSGPQNLPGVDKLDIRQGAEFTDTTVGVRQQIGERVYVELEQGIGPQSGRARVEIELTDDISVEGQAGADNRSRVGVYWKRDY